MELWKYCGKQFKTVLRYFVNNIWKQGRFPKEWETALVINSCNRGDKKICNSYRGIFLLSAASKVYAQILNRKLKQDFLNESLSGFGKGCSYKDASYSLKQILEKREFSLSSYVLFLNYKKHIIV